MSLTDFRNQLRLNPPVLPDLFWLAYNSIARAAANAVTPPFVSKEDAQAYYQAWLTELNNYVALNGKFSKFETGYFPFSPPPFMWDYKCRKCRAYIPTQIVHDSLQNATSPQCQWVEGNISPSAWCSIWSPPDTYAPFTWINELLGGNW
jgi:hypothetical protein